MKHIFFASAIMLIVFAACAPVFAGATACCSIPTADIMEPGTVRFEFENDGASTIGAGDSVSYFFTQYGITPNLEFGLDRSDMSGEKVDTMNVKYLLCQESDAVPAIAIGIMDADEESNRSYYAVGTKSFGRLRTHLGLISADYSKGPMCGCDFQLTESTYLLADWMKGPENFTSLGVCRTIGRFDLTFTYGLANGSDVENYSALNLAYRMPIAISF